MEPQEEEEESAEITSTQLTTHPASFLGMGPLAHDVFFGHPLRGLAFLSGHLNYEEQLFPDSRSNLIDFLPQTRS